MRALMVFTTDCNETDSWDPLRKILDHDFATRPLVRPNHYRQACVPRVGQLELLPHRLGAQCILDPEAGLPKLVGQGQDVR